MFPTALVLCLMSHVSGVKPRPRHELVMRAVHPLVAPGVGLLRRLGAEPWQVVVSHGVLGVAAAVLAATSAPGAWVAAAVLLQLRTVLDNLDGALARVTGRVTELGRYLDTGVDFIVSACLFVALAFHGPPLLAALAFLVLTFVLSYDFNAERLYREAHVGSTAPAPALNPSASDSLALRAFRSLYTSLLAPQDRAVGALERHLLRSAAKRPLEEITEEERRSWWGIGSTAALVNLGLSTQHLALGICLVAGRPFTYVWLVLAQGVYLVVVLCVRYLLHRRRWRAAL